MTRSRRVVLGIVLAAAAVGGGCNEDAANVGTTLRVIESDLSGIPSFNSAVLRGSRLEEECLDRASGDQPFVVLVYELPGGAEAPGATEVLAYYEDELTEREWEFEQRSGDSAEFSAVMNGEDVVAFVSVSSADGESTTYDLWASLRRDMC